MIKMRRSDKRVTDTSEIKKIIDACKVLRMAFKDSEGLCILPLNFGYEFENEKLKLYFHGAEQGRKARFLKSEQTDVAFEMDCDHALDDNDIACKVGFFYSSIVGTGKANIIEDEAEKVHAVEFLKIEPGTQKNALRFSMKFRCKCGI